MARLFRPEDLISENASETAKALHEIAYALESGEMTVEEIMVELKSTSFA